jgi:hypothetical protein
VIGETDTYPQWRARFNDEGGEEGGNKNKVWWRERRTKGWIQQMTKHLRSITRMYVVDSSGHEQLASDLALLLVYTMGRK